MTARAIANLGRLCRGALFLPPGRGQDPASRRQTGGNANGSFAG